MANGRETPSPTSAIVTVLILVATLLAAIGLAQTDYLFLRPTPSSLVMGALATATRPTQALATHTPTATNTHFPTPTPSTNATLATGGATGTAEITSTAVAVLPGCATTPAEWVAYTIQAGDNLFALSVRSGATVSEIEVGNCITMPSLQIGSTLYLPVSPPVRPVCGPPIWWVRYTVQANDTLFSLATRHVTTVYAVMNANCLSSSNIQAGRQLFLPPLAASPTPLPIPTIPPTATPVVATATPSTTPIAPPTATSTLPAATATDTPPPATATDTPTTPPTSTATTPPTPTDTPAPTNTPRATLTPSTP